MPIPFRMAVGFFVLLVLSGALAVAFVVLWPKPISAVLAGAAGCALTATMLVLYIGARGAHVQLVQLRKAIFVQPRLLAFLFLGIAWKNYKTSPSFSSASLISAGLFGLGAIVAFVLTRSTALRDT